MKSSDGSMPSEMIHSSAYNFGSLPKPTCGLWIQVQHCNFSRRSSRSARSPSGDSCALAGEDSRVPLGRNRRDNDAPAPTSSNPRNKIPNPKGKVASSTNPSNVSK
ncbi:hypothetical protein Cni_G13002 [Canna indica]|uniref:Uncharacterized protein n=1 Tax=Canna indica TaxID=4628 RepID=A0AAQ3Q9I0_9LILI|nr:hypothetical protein Cni_G13002 [Canna indica]